MYKIINYLTFHFGLGVRVALNIAHYPLHHMTNARFEVALSRCIYKNILVDLSHKTLSSTRYII